MKLKTFFAKFDQFAEAPNAVAKLRELMLELAVRGKLTEQSDSDPNEPAWRSFASKNEKLKNRPLSDLPFDIPDSWLWVTLNALGETKPRNNAPDAMAVSFVPMALIPAKFGKVAQHEVRQWNEIKKGYTHFADGDVVMAKITPCYENGKSAVIGPTTGGIGAGTTELHVFRRSSEVIDPRFVLVYIKSRGFIERGVPRMTGSAGQKRVPHDYFANSPFPLPPPAEQKRIVAKVDELMALCDRLEAQLQERDTRHAALARAALARFAEAPTSANLDLLFHNAYAITPADLRKTILTLAVQGKLVPQDPEDEPAADAICRLGLQSSIEGNEELLLPTSWVRVRFEDIAVVAGGVTLGRKLAGRKAVSLPYLRVANVKRGELDLSVIKEISIPEEEIDRYALRKNDLLMTEGGDWDKVGRAAIWRGEIPSCLHQNHIFRARMRSAEISPVWFERYFNSPNGRGYFETASKQTTNLASINMRQVRGCPVPFPPLAEQHRIVAKVEEFMALVDQLEAQITASRAMAEKLMDALVAELVKSRPSVGIKEEKTDEKSVQYAVLPIVPSPERSRQKPPAAFIEAVVIAQLTRALATPEYPLGRLRYNKLAYLAHRKAEDDVTQRYLKKAAGPYSPWAKYQGPEKIALGKGYVKRAKAGDYEGFILGERVSEIDQYLPHYPVCAAVTWIVERLRYKKKEELELLATVDFAALELRTQGSEITRDTIKHVIATNREWAPKLNRDTFSDENIDKALADLSALFPTTYS